MECLGSCSRPAALSASLHDWRRFRRRRRILVSERRGGVLRALRVSCCGGGGGGGAVTTKVKGVEDFAGEEDYIKAGGSEIVYVEMQGMKRMELQDKISDKVN